jgi:large subunit ribosomal protein L25
MRQQDMTAAVRQDFGKGAAHRLRRSGYAPAILYGKKAEPIALAMETRTLTRNLLRLHGHNVVVSLDIEGEKGKKKHHVLIKDIQTDPITNSLLHVDFLEIDMDKEIVLDVPIVYTGTAKGVDLGGILNIMAHTVKIKGMPLAIPDEISIDVTPLELSSHGITCGELAIPDGVTLEDETDKLCVSIVAPKAVVEEGEEGEAGEAGEAAEAVEPSAEDEASAASEEE